MRREQSFVYCCVICGLCYEDEQDVVSHLRMQHQSKEQNPMYIRKRGIR